MPEHVAIARHLIEAFKTRAKLVLRDGFGWSLYEIVQPTQTQQLMKAEYHV